MAIPGCLGVGRQEPVGALARREEQEWFWAACRGEGGVGARHTSRLQLMVPLLLECEHRRQRARAELCGRVLHGVSWLASVQFGINILIS